MQATTVTNEDGSFSPAIDWDTGSRRMLWADKTFCNKDENKMVLLAQAHLKKINEAITRLLIEGHYRVQAEMFEHSEDIINGSMTTKHDPK